jgi:hypothetical protein
MKHILNFSEWLNESLIVEGTLASKAFKDKDLYDFGKLENAWDESWQPFSKEVAKKLGVSDTTKVIQSDENSEDESALGGKIYDFLNKNFKGEEFDNDFVTASYDKNLNVVRTEDMGFTAYQFTADSKF